jgi:putative SOS response-associated peptidase YedK
MEARSQIVRSCRIITMASNDTIAQFHDRMPVILDERDCPKWLGEKPAT